MSYSTFITSPLGDIEQDTRDAGCAREEKIDPNTGQCVPLTCEGLEAPYFGTCMSLERQKEIAKEKCAGPSDLWIPGQAACHSCPPPWVPEMTDNGLECKHPQTGEVVDRASVDVSPWLWLGGAALLGLVVGYARR